MAVHNIKVKESGSYILTRGNADTLFLFSEEQWEAFYEKLRMLPLTNVKARAFKRHFLSDAYEVEVGADLELQISDIMWEYLVGNKSEVEFDIRKRPDRMNPEQYGSDNLVCYGQWAIEAKENM